MEEFLTDVQNLRDKIREHIEKGPVIDPYGADLERVLFVLNQALATGIVCELRYKHQFFVAEGLNALAAADEFLEHAGEESEHADLIAGRIQQLGGRPDLNPDTLTGRSQLTYDSSEGLLAMIREDLVAEHVAISAYHDIIAWLGESDPATRRLLESILSHEEEHGNDMLDLLAYVA